MSKDSPKYESTIFAYYCIEQQAKAIQSMGDHILDNSAFADVVDLLFECKGIVHTSGVGKSGIVAKKMAGTLSATGTPAFYTHPLDAMHGNLGTFRQEDTLILFSKSGTTKEMLDLLAKARKLVGVIIGITTRPSVALAIGCTKSIVFTVKEEAGPIKLVPTTSTTCMMVLGDALALSVMKLRGFTLEDYIIRHPGGEK